MPTLWDLVAPFIGQSPLDAPVQRLLDSVSTSITQLTEASQLLGSADPAAFWPVVCELLPVSRGAPSPFGQGAPVRARRIGAGGWEATIELPAVSFPIPGTTRGTLARNTGGQIVVPDAAAGPVSFRLPETAFRVTAPGGSDVSAALGPVTASLDPPVLALPAGFGVRVGDLEVGPDGVNLPDVAFFLPALPSLPTGPIPCPVRFGRTAGVFAQTGSIPLSIAGLPDATFTLAVDRPTAESLVDLVPTSVSFEVSLDGVHPDVVGVGPVAATATVGSTLGVAGTISLTPTGARLDAALTGNGDERGLARISGENGGQLATTLPIAGAFGPHLPLAGSGASPLADMAALIAAATAISAFAARPEETELTLHEVAIRSEWAGAAPDAMEVVIDYEAQVALAFSAGGFGVSTKPGRPYRVRHRQVTLVPAAVPTFSWGNASTTVVSMGDWEVTGIPPELLRIADVRMGSGSLLLEFDLRVALELGPVTVDGTTLRVVLDGGTPRVELGGFGVSLVVPGTVEGRGLLEFREGRFDAALDVRLPSLGSSGRAAVAREGDMLFVSIGAELFAPIPFANSGLGLFGFAGQLAWDAKPHLPAIADPIEQALAWNPEDTHAWMPGNDRYVGFGVTIGTVPDLMFSLKAEGSLLIGLPDPSLRLAVRAWLMRGLAGTMLGVVLVDGERVTIGVRGQYEIPVLLNVTVPAGATFPLHDLAAWSARMGGDRAEGRGEPVLAKILPDLLDVEAWAFLLTFGRADTMVGEALAGPPGQQLSGLSLGFGAGFEVHWSTGPFSFDAGGVILAALTHRPAPDGAAGPWIMAGRAELHGSVDLGPLSIGASADLQAIVDPAGGVFFARAEACASVDLWFTSIEGCVSIELGNSPSAPAPDPGSPLLRVALTDRLGVVTGQATEAVVDAPTVWPDTVPVLVFDTWVGQADPLPGLGRVIGDDTPSDDGWVGSGSLAYRFELTGVHVWEVDDAGGESEVGGDWLAAWQLPLYADVYGSGDVPARARSLALNHLDLHHSLQSATALPEGQGDPLSVLARLCIEAPAPPRLWFRAEHAVVPPGDPMAFLVDPGTAGEADPTTASVLVQTREAELPVDDMLGGYAETGAWAGGPPLGYQSPGIETLDEPFDVEDQRVTGVAWLPHLAYGDMRATIALRLDAPARDVVVYMATLSDEGVELSHAGTSWRGGDVLDDWGRLLIRQWRSPAGETIDGFEVRTSTDRQVGVLAISLTGDRAAARAEENDRNRRRTHETLDEAAGSVETTRKMLKPGRSYRVDVSIRWDCRGTIFNPRGDDMTRSFWFSTARKEPRPAPTLPSGAVTSVKGLIFQSVLAMRQYDQSVLEDADLGRYVGGFVPPPDTLDHLFHDPVQVEFVVDHLPQLAAAYDSCLTVSARRTDAPRGTPPADIAPIDSPLPPPTPTSPGPFVAPLVGAGLSALDVGRLTLALAREASPEGCRFPRPGLAAGLKLEPQAAYELSVTVDVADAQGHPLHPGIGTVIARSRLRTSRYANALSLFADLGLVEGPHDAEMPGFAVTGAVSDGDAGFDGLLEQLGLGGYRAADDARAAGLWEPGAETRWSLVGVLLEAPEPIDRADRLKVTGVTIGGRSAALYFDARRTRALATVPPSPAAAGTRVEVTFEDHPPRESAHTYVVGSALAAYPPGSAVTPP